jgi:hypothetical protein
MTGPGRRSACAHPHLRGALVDLPGTVARAVEHLGRAGVADRVRFLGQSFFDPLPAGADVYVLQRCSTTGPIARPSRSSAVAPRLPGGVVGVLVAGGVRADRTPVVLHPEMVLLGGRTDDLMTFRTRAAEAGLEVVSTVARARGGLVVECRPT